MRNKLKTLHELSVSRTEQWALAILDRMKMEIDLPELFSAGTFGALLGLASYASHQRWASLGRDAYLAHYAENFDRHFSRPSNPVAMTVISIILMLVALAAFKSLASLYRVIGSALQKKSGTAHE
jgi:hypothetical protein